MPEINILYLIYSNSDIFVFPFQADIYSRSTTQNSEVQ